MLGVFPNLAPKANLRVNRWWKYIRSVYVERHRMRIDRRILKAAITRKFNFSLIALWLIESARQWDRERSRSSVYTSKN